MKTVKVRIAVAVDTQGNWASSGWSEKGDQVDINEYMADIARECVGEGEALYWVEAEIPMPEVQTIQGDVFEND